MTDRDTAQQRARELQHAEGIGYQTALNRVLAEASAQACADPTDPPVAEAPNSALAAVAYVLQPTAAEAAAGITAEELGVRALPADASPELRAHAEAVWRPNEADQPCRCSGTKCHHGARCEIEMVDGACGGRMIHLDRYPGSMFDLTAWYDTHRCEDCGNVYECTVDLPHLPWGEVRERGRLGGTEQTLSDGSGDGPVMVIFDGIRHPNFGGGQDDVDDDEFDLDPDLAYDYDGQGDFTAWAEAAR